MHVNSLLNDIRRFLKVSNPSDQQVEEATSNARILVSTNFGRPDDRSTEVVSEALETSSNRTPDQTLQLLGENGLNAVAILLRIAQKKNT